MKIPGLFFLVMFALCTARSQEAPADAILGEWVTADGKAHVSVYKCDGEYCGKIGWLREPEKDGKPVLDDKNPDERLRYQPVLGLQILRGFVFDGDDEWAGGKIYDPESGNDYSAKITLQGSDTIKLRGYILLPMFGRTEVWKRVQQP